IPPQKTGYVTVDQLNVRQSASSIAKSIAKVNKGTSVTILSNSGSWSKITIPSLKLTGWVASSYITDKASIVTSPDSEFKKTLTGKTIVIDAGHGGRDPGTSGKIYLEKTLNLETAKELAFILRSAGAKVVMTRETDVYLTLAKRVQVSHANNADVFISVHYNATSNTSVNGVDTFYWTTHANEKKLAENIQQEVIKETGLKNRGALTGNFQVIRDNKNAAVLVELGFLSNEQEERKVASKDYQIKAATGIYNGLIRYFAK
ncbi:N-acetylmuramoyl-L-alanine amidase, partial [Peribacillus loiseleuriae]|uniref:N-acetylmuramoyl-L-alanine amidase n=1 Tax=Peribacillus loiseleuriae TaxID=1679170 RepID=UPI003CFBDDA7